MDVFDAIRNRRSIRRYKDIPVEDSKLEQVLDAARLAPSWSNVQAWRFIAVRDSNTKTALAGTLVPLERGETPVNNPAVGAVGSAPVVIVACGELGKSGFRRTEPGVPATDKGDWFMFDVALAVQSLALAAHGLGLGTLIVGLFDAGKVASILEIPAGFAPAVIIPLGYPDQEPKPRPRKALNEIIFHEKFGG